MLRKKIKRALALTAGALALAAGAALVAAYTVPLPARLNVSGSRVVEYADGTPMRVFLSPDDMWRIPVDQGEVDPDFIEALIQFEDERFFYHPGVDPISICRAVLQNLTSMRIESGASTITMQLVRIVEPRPRTFRSKAVEAARAMQLELFLSKKEILEGYLRFAPYGRNIEGVEAASLAYFGHRCTDLSPYEIVYLLGVPQRPAARYPTPENAERAPEVTRRVTRRLVEAGAFDEREAADAKSGSPPTALRRFPKQALHVSRILAARSEAMRVRTTIEQEAQSLVESSLDRYRAELSGIGVYNGSAVVVEVDTGRVLAAVGNFDFWDDEHQGQVAGFLAPRSPGSSMKPFIYALAIDRGIALPDYLIADAPVRYRGYSPINYDHRYRGLVRLDDALSMSLNLPFVTLLGQVGMDEYIGLLRAGGITTLSSDRDRYGLSIAVGALEARPAELANLYAMLARGGLYRNLVWTHGQETGPPRRLLSPAACWLTRQALRRKDRPDFPGRFLTRSAPQEVFWKTGTSAKHRDAWSAGAAGGYAAVVWLGNFDGRGARGLVGGERAGPVLFDVLEGMSRINGGGGPDPRVGDLIDVEVCAWSGRIAGPHCPETRTVPAPMTSVPAGTCPFHVQYLIDKASGMRLNPLCARGRDAEHRTYTVLPAPIRRWIGDKKLMAQAPPVLHPSCRVHFTDAGPSISYPSHHSVFFLIPGLESTDQEIRLEAEAGPDAGDLNWFVDGVFVGAAPVQERVWLTPTPGDHEITVSDRAGRSHSVRIRVMTPG